MNLNDTFTTWSAGPSRSLDLTVLLETTADMARRLPRIRKALEEALRGLRRQGRHVRVGVVCYRDHGDEATGYVTTGRDLNANVVNTIDLIRDTAHGVGGDGGCALECALARAAGHSWRGDADRAILVIGSRPPHGAGMNRFRTCPNRRDYRVEIDQLRRRGIRVHTLAVGRRLETRRVFEWMAAETEGEDRRLVDADDIGELLADVTDPRRRAFKALSA